MKNLKIQFKEYSELWSKENNFILMGASKECSQLLSNIIKTWDKKSEFNVKFIIDDTNIYDEVDDIYQINEKTFEHYDNRKPKLNNKIKIKKINEGLKNIQNKIIITSESRYNDYKNILISKKLKEDIDFTSYKKFSTLIPLFSSDKLNLWRSDILLTEKCTLNCTFCNMYMPNYENPEDKETNLLKKDVDLYFKHIDFVSIFHLVGGEPFLFKDIGNFIDHIAKYRDKIDHLTFTTNGTLVPKDEIIEKIKENQIHLSISDYTDHIKYKRKLEKLIGKIEKAGIKYALRKEPDWIDFGDPRIEKNFSDEEMIRHFKLCTSPYRAIDNGKFYYCHMETSARRSGIIRDDPNDYLNLNDKNISKLDISLFDLGHVKKGYLSFCKRCNGCNTGIELPVTVASQGLREINNI